ncbi:MULTISPECIES: dipeptidase [unclassified Streptomyces]|uniref:dipeptidase n=1 Tax=unclassified Streptomyces TaxID=2593676 RepID=UPI0036EE8544
MADLQSELTAATEIGELDELTSPTTDEFTSPTDELAPPTEEAPQPPADDPLDRARALLTNHPVADGYCGLPATLRTLPWYDLELGESSVDTDLPRLRDGGVGSLLWTLRLLPGTAHGEHPVTAVLEQLDLAKHVVAEYPEGLRAARSASELCDARDYGRIGVLMGPAPAAAIGDSLATLRALHKLDLRVLALSGTSWATEAGLTRFGEEVVREMNRLGVLADLTGASERTVRRVLAVAKAPVIFTHSGAHALNSHPDNVPDDLLADLGAARGVCLVPCSAERTGAELGDVADHLDHVRRVAGPQSVGLSGAYDTGAVHPDGLADVSRYPHLIAELIARGWPDSDLAQLTWGNVQRVLRETEFAARAAALRRPPSTARIEGLDA